MFNIVEYRTPEWALWDMLGNCKMPTSPLQGIEMDLSLFSALTVKCPSLMTIVMIFKREMTRRLSGNLVWLKRAISSFVQVSMLRPSCQFGAINEIHWNPLSFHRKNFSIHEKSTSCVEHTVSSRERKQTAKRGASPKLRRSLREWIVYLRRML